MSTFDDRIVSIEVRGSCRFESDRLNIFNSLSFPETLVLCPSKHMIRVLSSLFE